MKTIGKTVCVIGCLFFLSCIVVMPVVCEYAKSQAPRWLVSDVTESRRELVQGEYGLRSEYIDRVVGHESYAINATCIFTGVLCLGFTILCATPVIRDMKA